LLVAPHEPDATRVDALLRRIRGRGLRAVTLGTVERGATVGAVDVVVIDRVGVLAHLYTVASAAYVGGGFGRDGLHSVLEPAAAGVPTVFGPRYECSRAAGQLLQLGGARTVQDGSGLQATVLAWLTDPDAKKGAGARALEYIGDHACAAARTAKLLDVLIQG
jgi:3-deoxy-D-manno-octulosonic-acid transferase